jgi:large subunit ribosomal protein L29
MAFKKIAEARELTDEQIVSEITTAKQKLFQLRLQQTTGRLEKPHEFKHTKRWIAQLMTVQTERQKSIRTTTTNTQA